MNSSESNELKEKYKSWSSDELIRAVTIDKDGYHFDVIELMKLELSNRNITPSEKENYKNASTQNAPYLRMTSLEQSWWSKFEDNYGWGWAILGFFFFKENQFINAYYGEYTSLFYLFGLGVSLGFYFLFRQKLLLTKLKITWLRSFTSGLITIVLTIPFILLLEVNDSNVSNILKTKLEQQKKYLYLFAQRDKTLWYRFNSEPKSINQLTENITLLDELIPLYKEKDSVLISFYRDILNAMQSSEKWKSGVPSLINDFQSIVEIATLIAPENQNYLINLRNYYYSLKTKDNQKDKYYTSYQKSVNTIQELTNRLSPILLRVTGKDLTKNIEEIQKEYYMK